MRTRRRLIEVGSKVTEISFPKESMHADHASPPAKEARYNPKGTLTKAASCAPVFLDELFTYCS